MKSKAEEYRLLAEKTLPEKRYLHTLEVEKECLYLASFFSEDIDIDALRCAALLHDITKYLTLDGHVKLAGSQLTDDDVNAIETLHAKSGAAFARQKGERYASAIECHTTGKPGMALFEIILFIADYTEATRRHDSCIKERTLLHKALEAEDKSPHEAIKESLIRILDGTVSHLQEKNTFIHPETMRTLEFYRGEP